MGGRVALHNLRFIRRQEDGWQDRERLFDDRVDLLAISTTRSTYSGKQHIAFKKCKNTREKNTKGQNTMSTDWATSPHRLATEYILHILHISIFSSYELIFKKIVIPSLALNAMHWEGDSPVA